ncbi:uncharacterized protein LOC125674350 isoform X1 [Ostrea edulis]|uniref:uncharacterized protein LOC130048404 n=1 Tax=Ostrea edulis TaxID=37623 RepID=UPI0024AFB2B8|nr:uncharacterized protein LOC130048404 [Ostrea edulis]XP_056015270.1 uncharacterized protein LOC125674350 isoform X1 [Ostrea edulis]
MLNNLIWIEKKFKFAALSVEVLEIEALVSHDSTGQIFEKKGVWVLDSRHISGKSVIGLVQVFGGDFRPVRYDIWRCKETGSDIFRDYTCSADTLLMHAGTMSLMLKRCHFTQGGMHMDLGCEKEPQTKWRLVN